MNSLSIARRSGRPAPSPAIPAVRLLAAAVGCRADRRGRATGRRSGPSLPCPLNSRRCCSAFATTWALDDDSLAEFTYTLERRTYDVNFVGKVSSGDIRTYEVVPSPFEPGRTWRRLVAVNGVRLSQEQLRRDEAKARQEADARRRARETRDAPRARPSHPARGTGPAEGAGAAGRHRTGLRFAPSLTRWSTADRWPCSAMTPRAGAETRSDVGRHLEKLRGRIWVDRSQAQLVKAEFETTADITVGLGVIGRVGSGSRMVYRRGRASDGTWLPVETRFEGSGRTLMLIPFHLETWAKYTDFRPMSPTATRGDTPHPPQ